MDNLDTKQPVLATGLLEKLADMFFKGIGSALDAAAEYEEEMGVLKQVNHIPIKSSDGNTYTLTLKLSPIKNKDSYYYVEAECKAPGLDVSKLNQKTFKIDNTNMKSFKKLIENFLNTAGYEGDLPEDASVQGVEPEQVGEEGNQSDSSNQSNDETTKEPDEGQVNEDEVSEVEKLLNNIEREYNTTHPKITSYQYGNSKELKQLKVAVKFDHNVNSDGSCILYLSGQDYPSGEEFIPDQSYEDLNVLDRKGNVKDFSVFSGDVQQKIMDFADKYQLSKNFVRSSTSFQASLVKEKGSNEVSLTAINCSTDIRAAMDIIYDLVEDPDFVNSLEDDTEQSFQITDEGSDYDIETIEAFDTSSTYLDMFAEVSQFANEVKVYNWALGYNTWNQYPFLTGITFPLSDIVDAIVPWVISHTGMYPVPVAPFGNQPTSLEDLKDESGKLNSDKICESVKAGLEDLIDALDIYYVNLDHNEQAVIDDYINSFKNALAYE